MPIVKTETTPTRLKLNLTDPNSQDFWNNERKLLLVFLFPLLADSIRAGALAAFNDIAAEADLGIAWDLINEEVIAWANKYTTEVVAQISKTSMAAFLDAFEPWVRSGEPLSTLIDQLKPFYGKVRAHMVAVTETTRAYHSGNVLTWKTTGVVEGFRFNTVGDDKVCPICQPLDGQQYQLNDLDHSPPRHVNCRCYSSPVVNLTTNE